MNSSRIFHAGDRVQYRAGRGFAYGRVAGVAEGTVTIATDGGKVVYRRIATLQFAPLGDFHDDDRPETFVIDSADLKGPQELAGA